MRIATLVHIENAVEYYQDGDLITPTSDQKLLWAIIGMPSNVERVEATFESELSEYSGFSRIDIQEAVNTDFRNGVYSFLPAMGHNQTVEVRFHF
jgi:hypothetical protein